MVSNSRLYSVEDEGRQENIIARRGEGEPPPVHKGGNKGDVGQRRRRGPGSAGPRERRGRGEGGAV